MGGKKNPPFTAVAVGGGGFDPLARTKMPHGSAKKKKKKSKKLQLAVRAQMGVRGLRLI